MRCREILLGVLYNPCQIDPLYACVSRAILVARRLVRKSRDRYDQLCSVFSRAIDDETNINTPGPAHGLARAMITLDGHVELDGDKLTLVFPMGTRVPLHLGNKTHLKEVIREAAAHVILGHLAERTENEEKGEDNKASVHRGRKDMRGISTALDEGTTKSLMTRRIAQGADLEKRREECEKAQHAWTVVNKARLDRTQARLFKCIIAGSPRSPTRLWSSMGIGDGSCSHPGCEECKADLEHVLLGDARGTTQQGRNT